MNNKNRKKVYIAICVLILVLIATIVIYKLKLKNNNIGENNKFVASEVGEEVIEKVFELNTGSSGNLIDLLDSSLDSKIEIIQNKNPNIIKINSDLSFNVLQDGEAEIELKIDDIKNNVIIIAKNVESMINTTESIGAKIDNCHNLTTTIKGETLYVDANGNEVTKPTAIKRCLNNFKIDENDSGYFQNIAITDKYFYVSRNNPSAEIKKGNEINSNIYIRFNKNDETKLKMLVRYAGHAQSFDAISDSSSNGDALVFNYFSVAKYEKAKIKKYKYNSGFAIRSFYGTTEGSVILPYKGYHLKQTDNGFDVSILHKTKLDESISADEWNNIVTQKAEENFAEENKNTIRPLVATDSNNDLLLIHQSNKFYVYSLSKFRNGKLDLKKVISSAKEKTTSTKNLTTTFNYGQGVEICGNYVYGVTDNVDKIDDKTKHYHEKYIKQYDINTGKLLKKIIFKTNNSEEAEGLAIYNGRLYVATKNIAKCKNKYCYKVEKSQRNYTYFKKNEGKLNLYYVDIDTVC